MIVGAIELQQKNYPGITGRVRFQHASVLDLPYLDNSFDVVTSHRWILVLMEGTFEGLERLNTARAKVGLEAIAPDGRERLITLKFHEDELLSFCSPLFNHDNTHRFGMYYFLTRIVQPLLVAPERPSYDHPINAVAREIARFFPDYEAMGHLVAFVLSKRR
jgi:hypothetical protein